MTRLRRFKLSVLATAAFLSACAATDSTVEAEGESQTSKPTVASLGERESLVPQPEGTPLPDRNPRIAHQWPPEIKQLVDNMLALFPRTPEGRPPSVREVELKMGITLTERALFPEEINLYSKQYRISGTRFVDPEGKKFVFGDRYSIRRAKPPAGMSQVLSLVIAPRQSGYCLNPYELAVYTGSAFVNEDTSPHVRIRYWPPAYVWGMFNWSNSSRYGGQGFSIVLVQDRDPLTRKITNVGCVSDIRVQGRYEEEK